MFFRKAYFQSCLFFFCRYFHDGLQTVEHFGTYIEDLVSKLSVIRQSQFEEKRDLEEVRNMLKTSPGFNKTVIFSSSKKKNLDYIFFKNVINRVTRSSLKKHLWVQPFKGWRECGVDLLQLRISPMLRFLDYFWNIFFARFSFKCSKMYIQIDIWILVWKLKMRPGFRVFFWPWSP